MTDHLDGSDDPFGVPARVLNLSDDFYGALGRVAALGALVELRFSDVVVQWGRDPDDQGRPMWHLSKKLESLRAARIESGQEFPAGLDQAVAAARSAMQARNELLHSMWPTETAGWRNHRDGSITTQYSGVPAVREVVGQLVEAVDALGPYLRSPID